MAQDSSQALESEPLAMMNITGFRGAVQVSGVRAYVVTGAIYD